MAIIDNAPNTLFFRNLFVDDDGQGNLVLFFRNFQYNEDGTLEFTNDVDIAGQPYVAQNTVYPFEQKNLINQHSQLIGLSNDDHLQYLTESRHDSLPADNPHSVTKAQVGLDQVDNTSDLNKPISNATQAALDTKADSTDLGWIQFSEPGYTKTVPPNAFTNLEFGPSYQILNTNGPAVASSWWDQPNGVFRPDSVGDFYQTRLSFTVQTNQSDQILDIALDIGGSQGVIWQNTIRLSKSAGTPIQVAVSIPVYTLSTFVQNGGKYKVLIPSGGSVTGLTLVVNKTFKA